MFLVKIAVYRLFASEILVNSLVTTQFAKLPIVFRMLYYTVIYDVATQTDLTHLPSYMWLLAVSEDHNFSFLKTYLKN